VTSKNKTKQLHLRNEFRQNRRPSVRRTCGHLRIMLFFFTWRLPSDLKITFCYVPTTYIHIYIGTLCVQRVYIILYTLRRFNVQECARLTYFYCHPSVLQDVQQYAVFICYYYYYYYYCSTENNVETSRYFNFKRLARIITFSSTRSACMVYNIYGKHYCGIRISVFSRPSASYRCTIIILSS